jgi:hypothetical protein
VSRMRFRIVDMSALNVIGFPAQIAGNRRISRIG